MFTGPHLITENLTISIDAGNRKSFTSGSSVWRDLSSNGYNARLNTGSPTTNPTFTNNSYFDFDGSNDYFYIESLNYGGGNTISEMSVFAWTKTTFQTGSAGVWDNNNWSILDFDRSEVFTFAINDFGEIQMGGASTDYGGLGSFYDLVGNKLWNDGEWHYIGWTFSVANQEIKMYGDGELDATFTADGTMTALGSGVTRYGIVGDGSEAGTEGGGRNGIYYTGSIAVIQFYDGKVLNASEVEQNFNAMRTRFGM